MVELNMKKSINLLNSLIPMIGGDAFLRYSNRGVPHILTDINKSNISICYFMGTKKYKIWTGCRTDNNVLIAEVNTPEEVVKVVKEVIG
jgi:hypothetical protein